MATRYRDTAPFLRHLLCLDRVQTGCNLFHSLKMKLYMGTPKFSISLINNGIICA